MNHRFSVPIFASLTQKIDLYKTLTRNHQREGAGAYFRRSGCSNRSIKGTAGDGNQASFHRVRSATVAENGMSILTIKTSLDIGAKLRLGKRTRCCAVCGFVTKPAAEGGPRVYAARLGMSFDILTQGLLPGVGPSTSRITLASLTRHGDRSVTRTEFRTDFLWCRTRRRVKPRIRPPI